MSLNLNRLLTIAFALFVFNASAQTGDAQPFQDLPPTSEFGKCYAKCKIPDQYETITVKRLKKEASTRLEKVAAEYRNDTERILVKEGSTKYRTIAATFKTVTEQVMVEPAKTQIRTVPAKYRTETRQVLVSEARGQWVKKKKYPNCFSENPEDCYVACYEEVPAVYRTEKYQVLDTPARTEEITIPAKYKTVSKKVIDQPARVEEIPVDAQYRTVSKRVLVSPETTRTIDIPAEYIDVKEKRLVKKGGYTIWTEILCTNKTTSSKVRQIQRALKDKGYDPGPIDGVLGIKTQAAMKQYQTDNGLPLGNLNMETLNSLGVN